MDSDPFMRHRALAGFGTEAQEALGRARVALVGMGGLGCPAAQYLAGAGVGYLTLIDSDSISGTNLHRQLLYGPGDVGRRKVEVAAARLREQAPWCSVTALDLRLTPANAEQVLAGHDLVLDGTDTWASRYLIADAAAALGLPTVWGAISAWYGQITIFDAAHRLRDLFPQEPDADLAVCEGGGVLGPLCGQVGTAMATQAVIHLTGTGTTLAGRLSVVDVRDGTWRTMPVAAREAEA